LGETCSANGGEKNRVYVIGRKARGKKSLRRPRRRWVDNINMELVEIGGVVLTGFIWLRIATGGELL
jgi:hypothetical protein